MGNKFEKFLIKEQHPAYQQEDLEIKNEEELRVAKKATEIGKNHQEDLSFESNEIMEAKEMAGVAKSHEEVMERFERFEKNEAVADLLKRADELKLHEEDLVRVYYKNGDVEEMKLNDPYPALTDKWSIFATKDRWIPADDVSDIEVSKKI